MKLLILSFFLIPGTTLISCNDKASGDSSVVNSSNSKTTVASKSTTLATGSADPIVGKWMMHLDAFDDNGNQQLEEAERKKAVPNRYALVLNADGTCRMQDIFTGTYTINTEKGNQVLQIQRKRIESEEDKDPPPDVYHIKSVTKNEMILLVFDGVGPTRFSKFKKV